MGQLKLLGTFILIGLFSIAIIGFAVNFAIDNEATIDISDDDYITDSETSIKGDLSSLRGDSEDTYSSLLETTIEGEVAPSIAPFSITSSNSLGVAKKVLKMSYFKIFGSDTGFNVFYYSLISFLTTMLVLFAYKTLRGNPD
jgi:hypothetical protein